LELDTKVGLPQFCTGCRYFGNLDVESCPACGSDLKHPVLSVTKMLNRAAMHARFIDSSAPAFLIGRQKTMIAKTAQEILSEDEEKYPALPLDIDP
jgi:hypothetical protein